MVAFHLATRVFLAGNRISDELRDKEQERPRERRRQNLGHLSEESLERSRGKEEDKVVPYLDTVLWLSFNRKFHNHEMNIF